MTSCPLNSVPTSTFEAVRQLLPEAFSIPLASLDSSRDPALLSQVETSCDELLFFCIFLANGLLLLLLLLHKPIAFERNLGSWPWSCDPFEKNSISVLRNHSVNAISWHLEPWIILSNVLHLDCLVYLLRDGVIVMRFLFIWVVTKRIQRCERDCLSGFVVFLSSRS